jgi:hypothetical protein
MAESRIRTAVGCLLLIGLVLGPAGAAGANTPSQTCPVPVVGDPDSVTLGAPSSPAPGVTAIGVTASETPPELQANTPTVTFALFVHGDTNLLHLLAELSGPTTSGPVSLSGPASGTGQATETIKLSAPGTYAFDWLALFDNGLHPCSSFDGTHTPLSVTAP